MLYLGRNFNGFTGFKCEWATVKHGRLYVGGLGKEWTSSEGEVINTDPQWVKSIGSRGEVEHIDWKHVYNKIRKIQLPYDHDHDSLSPIGLWNVRCIFCKIFSISLLLLYNLCFSL
jgi:hypothetical protein